MRRATESRARKRIRAAFEGRGALTLKQLRVVLGGRDLPATIRYHVRKLVAAGALVVTRDGQKVDGSYFRYRLK
jgi:hypothetical protein